jgi:hypothetical protein
VAATIGLAFYVPSPVLLLMTSLLSDRFPIMFSNIIPIVSAVGMSILISQKYTRKHAKLISIGIGLILISSFSISTLLIKANTTDLNMAKLIGSRNREYFTEAELSSFNFLAKYKGESFIFADYESYRYLNENAKIPAQAANPESATKGYSLLRWSELQSRGKLHFINAKLAEKGNFGIYSYNLNDESKVEMIWEKNQKIFDNSSVRLYYKQ